MQGLAAKSRFEERGVERGVAVERRGLGNNSVPPNPGSLRNKLFKKNPTCTTHPDSENLHM